MNRVVLDVNVIVSGFASPSGAPRVIIENWLSREFEFITSDHIFSKALRAWRNPYFRVRYAEQEASRTLALLRERATLVLPGHSPCGVAEDEEDDLVLATAVSGNATVLVPGDTGLLRIGEYEGIAIVRPREFVELIAPTGS